MRLISLAIALLTALLATAAQPTRFVHPGILHTPEQFAHMRSLIAQGDSDVVACYQLLRSHKCSQPDYQPYGPFETIARGGEFSHTKPFMEMDFSAAYQNALLWMLTGNEAHARKAAEKLCGYADTLKSIPDHNDGPLLVGLEGLHIAYSTEVLRHTYPGFTPRHAANVDRMLREIFLPVMEQFYTRPAYTNGNWGSIVTKAYMALAIMWDDSEMYARAKDFYLNARDNGTIANYISGATGQIQESGRDQGHSQLGLGALATICEMAWRQGDDLYSLLDNRLLKGFEYVAAYNMGQDVPFTQWTDVTGKYCNWPVVSDKGRGRFIPVYEMVYNHYVRRCGLEMPWTRAVIDHCGPEGYDRDQPAFGTLLFRD